jgi:hypothetical protein
MISVFPERAVMVFSSVALPGFGLDSVIEFSAAVIWERRVRQGDSQAPARTR